jgi:7,8-dihydroneopterin aldolase/epimerase/oxygenase
MANDIIFIDRLRVQARIGTTAAERSGQQAIQVSLRITTDCRPAGKSDQLADSIDYSKAAEIIRKGVDSNVFNLVEGLAESIAFQILEQPKAAAVWVKIEKNSIPDCDSVGVEIYRQRTK